MQFIQNAVKRIVITSRQRTMSFYAVARGHKIGVYDSWSRCEEQVKGFKGAKYKKFPTHSDALQFIETVTGGNTKTPDTTSSFEPQDCAVPLGRKATPPAKWKSKKVESPAKEPPVNFWPESDGDQFDEDGLTDAELLAIVANVESNTPPTTSTSTTNTTKRKSESKSTLPSKLYKHASRIWEPVGTKTIGANKFQVDVEDYVLVYTDGSCLNNGRDNACAGFGVYFDENHPLNAAKPVLGRVTNNVGEIQAAIYAIKVAKDVGIQKICISTDSQFLINAVTCWIGAWKRKNWKLKSGEPVKNVADFVELDALLADDNLYVKWNYVKAHKGIKGNEMADKLARDGADIFKRMHVK